MLIVRQSRVEWPQSVRARFCVGIGFRKNQSLFIVEAFLYKLSIGICFLQVAGHLVGFIVAACHVVMGERVVEFTVVDEVDSSCRANSVCILPSHLLVKNVSIGILQVYRLLRFF